MEYYFKVSPPTVHQMVLTLEKKRLHLPGCCSLFSSPLLRRFLYASFCNNRRRNDLQLDGAISTTDENETAPLHRKVDMMRQTRAKKVPNFYVNHRGTVFKLTWSRYIQMLKDHVSRHFEGDMSEYGVPICIIDQTTTDLSKQQAATTLAMENLSMDQKLAHRHELITGLQKHRAKRLVKHYILKGEHEDGIDYWQHFKSVDAVLEEFDLYVKASACFRIR